MLLRREGETGPMVISLHCAIFVFISSEIYLLENSTGASELSTHQGGISELEQMVKQLTFTRSETQRLMALLQSRTIEESPSPLLRLETSTTNGSLKNHGDERDNFHASDVGSRVLEEQIASHSEIVTDLPKTLMVSLQHPATMENLPGEVLVNIFIRLFAKQLAQMRSVSKSWNALLSQSSFVKSHLHRSIHNNDQIILVFYRSSPFTAHPCRFPHLELTNFIKLPVNPRFEYTKSIKVIGAVNGLICFADGDYMIHIWNPSLSAMLTLPPYTIPCNENNSSEIYLRFGFDPKTDDYKVVKLTGLTEPPIYLVNRWLQVEIYSMRRGSWELITARFPSHITNIIDGDCVCADGHDGHLHWLGYIGKTYDSERIVAFDLGSETFREIPLPDSTVDDYRSNDLGVLSRKLCVTSRLLLNEGYEFIGGSYPFGFTSHNVFVIEEDNRLVLYDPVAEQAKILGPRYSEKSGADKVVEYVDSLVWLTPPECEIVDGA
ncbi:unnamed protein product [Lactuca virosa]|uniref:F-box domain-containing protein n=1 Tax=Lactuca virosa TaxID=75947 RepID=A0AAU9MMC8_9ASTR|nr:unnamed protein product [Lactuca virosa]